MANFPSHTFTIAILMIPAKKITILARLQNRQSIILAGIKDAIIISAKFITGKWLNDKWFKWFEMTAGHLSFVILVIYEMTNAKWFRIMTKD